MMILKGISVRNANFHLCRLFMYGQLQHGEKIQLLYGCIIVCTKQAEEYGGDMFQNFAECFCTYYFSIIDNSRSKLKYSFYFL